MKLKIFFVNINKVNTRTYIIFINEINILNKNVLN